MIRALITLLFAMTLVGSAGAAVLGGRLRASSPEVRKAVVATIDDQLAAFRSGEVRRAHALTSRLLQAQTPLRTFVAIVQANYPELWANERAEYGLVRDDGARARVLVKVIGAEGEASFEYVLVREGAGWRVGSVLRHDPLRTGNA